MEQNTGDIRISGMVENVVYHNAVNGFTVMELNSSGELITAVGMIADAAYGEEIELTGHWDMHASFGRQFRFSDCKRGMPDTTAKLYRYLSSGTIKGVGPKTALKIVERFGDETLTVLENEPERLAVITGISKQKAIDIGNEFNHQYSMRKIMIELESYGISALECTSIYKHFGINAVGTIRENPYCLCGTVNGFGFERVEKLTRDMALEPNSEYRNRAGLLHIIKHNLYANGHTCIPRRKIVEPSVNLLGIEPEETEKTVDELIAMRQLVSARIADDDYLFLPDIFAAERNVADRFINISKFPPACVSAAEKELAKIEKENGIAYAPEQREAILTACEKGMLILTGGPGTGKTTTVKGIIDVFEHKGLEVLLCAPTGMAAKRLSEVTERDAKTIHRLLEVEWDESDSPVFKRDAQNPLSAGAIIIDEMSMVDVQLFDCLLDAVPLGCRIVLVGDSDQLPSVGPGNVLGDLIASGRVPVVCLSEIFRQARESLIVMNAHRIIGGEMPVLGVSDNDFFFMKRDSSVQAAQTVIELVARRIPQAYSLSPFDDIQVLCPSKKSDCGTVNLNLKLQAALNPHDNLKNEIATVGGRVFREGDKVMQIKNNYNIEWKKGSEDNSGIFNGDIGIIKRINYASGYMLIDFDGRIAEYPTDNLSELELSYAVTVHKSQGSEYPVVILPLIDCPPQLMYRNLLYTAVTRAKKLLIIVGSAERIEKMTENNRRNKRYSALKAFLCS